MQMRQAEDDREMRQHCVANEQPLAAAGTNERCDRWLPNARSHYQHYFITYFYNLFILNDYYIYFHSIQFNNHFFF